MVLLLRPVIGCMKKKVLGSEVFGTQLNEISLLALFVVEKCWRLLPCEAEREGVDGHRASPPRAERLARCVRQPRADVATINRYAPAAVVRLRLISRRHLFLRMFAMFLSPKDRGRRN